MGDKGGKKNKEKSQKQSSDRHKEKENDRLERQQKDKHMLELPAEKTAKKNTMVNALRANMKAVEKSNK